MVRIEKLELQNFKSFAKKTVITFPSNFSAIAGPNGSGKSNLLDGIVFVLGRTSAKSLRADRMLEMIFNGTKNKPPADFAKVTLFFDNSDKTFPIHEEKVIITRKVNRRGISIYQINGKTVTRETAQEILRAANIHPDGHNIILQGDITNLIEMSPLERREIVDEIAGITEFEDKRVRAQRELVTVEERLKESSVILTEKLGNLRKLEQESISAKKYQKLTQELDKLRASLAKQRLQEAEAAMKKLEEKISEKDVKVIDKELSEMDREMENMEKRGKEIGQKLFDRTKDIALIKEVEKIRSEIERKKDRIGLNRLEIERLGGLIKRLEILKQKDLEASLSKSVQEILKLGRTGVYGTIASLSKVPAQHQTAIEVTAGNHLQDVVVSDENVAIECVNHLKRNKTGRATFLPLDKIRPRENRDLQQFLNKKGVIGIAINLIEFDRKFYNAFSFVFGDTLIVENIEIAKGLGIGNARFVTLDGDLIERSGAIIGGYYTGKRVFQETEDIGKYVSQKSQTENEIKQMETDIVRLQKNLEQLTTEEQLGSKELTKLQKERQELDARLESLRSKRRRLFEEKMIAQEDINKINIRKAKLEAELENIKLEFENYKKSETYNISSEILEGRIQETIKEINSLGAINMKALEEYEQQKVVYEELKEKVEKLTEERNKVVEIMADIEGKRKEAFMKTLEGIREQFKAVFKDMTGGDADLRLSGGMDSGLLIEASPAAKKLLNIDAMSGGEKTLVALAFLFSVQRFRPTPFYILDEIDAALDKPNTRKAADLIKNYSKNAQFIVITHNDTTIQSADTVYGCSMTDGESQIIAIKMPS